MMKIRLLSVIVAASAAMLLITACSSQGTSLDNTTASTTSTSSTLSSISSSKTDYPTSFFVETENYFDYQPGTECAAFSSAYLLRHYGQEVEGLKLYEDFPSKVPDGSGVFPDGIVTLFRSKGFDAQFVTDGTVSDIKRELSKGAPVIVFIHVEEPYDNPHYTHYIPVVGYDEEYLYFAESLEGYANCKDENNPTYNRKTEIDKFMRLWSNIDGYYDYPYYKIAPRPADSASGAGTGSITDTASTNKE